MDLTPTAPRPVPPGPPRTRDEDLRRAATELETVFLAQMLRAAGLGAPPSGFGGGVGEAQVTSVLVEAQARAMAERGGIGLAESLLAALAARTDV